MLSEPTNQTDGLDEPGPGTVRRNTLVVLIQSFRNVSTTEGKRERWKQRDEVERDQDEWQRKRKRTKRNFPLS